MKRRPAPAFARLSALLPALLLIGLVSPLAARGAAEYQWTEAMAAAPETREITDGLGRTVTIPSDPTRIVTAGRAVMMTANALWAFESAPERVVGVGRISQGRGNFLPRLDPQYNRIMELEHNVGPEQVAALNPDLVILKSVVRSSLGAPLERLGIPVVYVDLETPEQYQRDLAVLGSVLNEEDRARELQEYYHRITAEIATLTAEVATEDRPSTLLLYYRGTGGDVSFNVPPAEWMQTTLVELGGGRPVWHEANRGGGWGTVSFEQIAAWDPEVIILVEYGGRASEIRDRLREQPRWQALRALAGDRFYAMPLDHYSWDQPDVRWLLGLQWTAKTLHPERFARINLEEELRRFYRTLYGLDENRFEELISPVLAGDIPRENAP